MAYAFRLIIDIFYCLLILSELIQQQAIDPNRLPESVKASIRDLSSAVATVSGGITGGSLVNALIAGVAGQNAAENNYLSDAQAAQEQKELKQCTNIGCTAKVKTQWAAISAAQQASFTAGIVVGLPAETYDVVKELVHMTTNPIETYEALKGLFTSGNILENVSDAVKESYISRLNKLEEEYQRAGAGGSYNAGIETGKLLLDMAALATGVGGAAKAGIKVTEKAIAKVANAAKKEVIEASKGAGKGANIAGEGTSVDSKKIVDVNAGSKGEWNKLLNKPEPNTIYKVDGNKVYHTDELGRVSSVESDLNLLTKDRNIYQQCKAGRCGIDGDEGGHLLASIFNGPGEKLNLVPMNSNLNRGAWKQMENTWAKALKDGKNVKVKIEPIYNSNSVRPDKFHVTYSINGKTVEETFKNAPKGI